MKKFIPVLLLLILCLTSCKKAYITMKEHQAVEPTIVTDSTTKTSEPSTTPSPTPIAYYQYDEQEFKKAYEEALDLFADGNRPLTKANTDPSQTDFAVIPLDKEIYGVESFAVLPIQYRELTKEELLQLADGMKGISFVDLISSKYSYTGIDSIPINRGFMKEEQSMYYECRSLYANEDIRPKNPISKTPSNGNLFYLEIQDKEGELAGRMCFLPVTALTKDQMLQYFDYYFHGDEYKEYFKPLEEELSFEEAKKLTKDLISDYGILKKEPVSYNLFYDSLRGPEHSGVGGKWTATITSEDAFDYIITFTSLEGNFLSWTQIPYTHLSNQEVEQMFPSPDPNLYHSNEEITKAATDYVKNYVLKKDDIIASSNVNYGSYPASQFYEPSEKDFYKTVTFYLQDNKTCNVSVIASNLKIRGLDLGGWSE